jgi:hypothetical protein
VVPRVRCFYCQKAATYPPVRSTPMKIGQNQYIANDGSMHSTQGFAHMHDMHRAQQRAHAHNMQRAHANFLGRSNDFSRPLKLNSGSRKFGPFSALCRLFGFVFKACIIIAILWLFLAGNGLAVVARLVDSFVSVATRSPTQFVPGPSQPRSEIIFNAPGIGRVIPEMPHPLVRQHR